MSLVAPVFKGHCRNMCTCICAGALAAAAGRRGGGGGGEAGPGAGAGGAVRGHHHRAVPGRLRPHARCAAPAGGQLRGRVQPGSASGGARGPAGALLAACSLPESCSSTACGFSLASPKMLILIQWVRDPPNYVGQLTPGACLHNVCAVVDG